MTIFDGALTRSQGMIPKPINIHGIANSVFEFLSCWDSSERPHDVQLPPCLQAGVDCTKCAAPPPLLFSLPLTLLY